MSGNGKWPVDDVIFDRLVDGQLSAEEYRELLGSLDNVPDGWRRCAVAFLESQALSAELPAVCGGNPSRDVCSGELVRPRSYRRAATLCVTVAASFVLAFWLGVNAQLPERVPDVPPRVTAGSPESPASEHLAQRPELNGEPHGNGAVMPVTTEPWGDLTLYVPSKDGQSEQIQLPVFELEDDLARSLLHNTAAVPAEVQRALQTLGYEVRSARQWTPVPITGSRRVLVPIDQVEITPTARRSFQ